ncbi:Protein C18G1.1 [Aphelenchoides avenae]|nr:Protein C18G1.1 [Aphelenchus avenae]
MLFLNARPMDVDANAKYSTNTDDGAPRCLQRDSEMWNPTEPDRPVVLQLTKVHAAGLFRCTVVILSIYFVVSCALALFNYPISLTTLIFPLLAALFTSIAVRTKSEQNLWFTAIVVALCTLTKVVAIIAYASIFGFDTEDKRSNYRNGKPQPSSLRDEKRLFFLVSFKVLEEVCQFAMLIDVLPGSLDTRPMHIPAFVSIGAAQANPYNVYGTAHAVG